MPPCELMISSTIAKPSPTPDLLRLLLLSNLKKGLKTFLYWSSGILGPSSSIFMIILFVSNFLITLVLLKIYLTKLNHNILFDHNPLGYGSKKKTKTGAGIVFSIILLTKIQR